MLTVNVISTKKNISIIFRSQNKFLNNKKFQSVIFYENFNNLYKTRSIFTLKIRCKFYMF